MNLLRLCHLQYFHNHKLQAMFVCKAASQLVQLFGPASISLSLCFFFVRAVKKVNARKPKSELANVSKFTTKTPLNQPRHTAQIFLLE